MIADAPIPGRPMRLRDTLLLVLAPNPSPMTHWGTNTYILGQEMLAIIDPGPVSEAHLEALLDAIDGRPVTHIFVTHSHLDHSPLALPLSLATGAAVFAFGDSNSGQSQLMRSLSAEGLAGGGEGVDRDFRPDQEMKHGQKLRGAWGGMTALHTPGHMGNHMCYRWEDALFCGDHVMGWASSLVSPPDGDLTAFMRSCAMLLTDDARIYYPAHGAAIADPKRRLQWLIAHRQRREKQIVAALADGPATSKELAAKIYDTTPNSLLEAAARNVFAHLVDLSQRQEVKAIGGIRADASFVRNR